MALELEWERFPGFSSRALDRLLSYNWPGNVRELRNVVERAVYRWEQPDEPVDQIQFDPFESPWRPQQPVRAGSPAEDSAQVTVLPASAASSQPSPWDPESCADFRLAIAEYEKAILAAALEKCRWNQRAAATALSLSYDQLRHAMKRHQLMA
jgi:psp operon transcriptional activator